MPKGIFHWEAAAKHVPRKVVDDIISDKKKAPYQTASPLLQLPPLEDMSIARRLVADGKVKAAQHCWLSTLTGMPGQKLVLRSPSFGDVWH